MELARVHIHNFRSIENCTLNFDYNCRVLVGINEAGKTNILKALSLLDENIKVDSKDRREFKDDEPIEQEAFVNFYFRIDQKEKNIVFEKVASKIASKNIDQPFISINGSIVDLKTLINNYIEIQYKINLNTKKKTYTAKFIFENPEVIELWKKPTGIFSFESLTPKRDINIPISEILAIDVSDFFSVPNDFIEDLQVSEIIKVINFGVEEFIEEMPNCIFWQYDEKNLLPNQVSLSSFIQNPDICIPLKNMFFLAGVTDIQKTITDYQQRPFGMRNLLDRISNKSSEHLHKVWKEYKDLQLVLTLNGDAIETAVKDRHKLYDLSRRSDGFKRFISFILLVSMRAKSNELKNTLLLYDEPEISLHPSGCRHLRNELIKISENNYVVFSTHSIFMIDQNITNRHYIVVKESEVTKVKEVNESNITDEEVLYNALNYSIFENLKKNNIIFEGWRDKHLFKIATEKTPTHLDIYKNLLEELGFCHSQGVKNIAQLAADLELGKRKYLIISDSDKAAIEKQSEFRGDGTWLRYDEIISNETVITGEDFVKKEVFLTAIANLKNEFPKLEGLQEIDLTSDKGKISEIVINLEKAGFNKNEIKVIIEKIKDKVFSNLKNQEVEEKYYLIIEKIARHFWQ